LHFISYALLLGRLLQVLVSLHKHYRYSSTDFPYCTYILWGLSATQYQIIKKVDQKKLDQNLGGLGPQGFTSCSMQSWQNAYEHGERRHSIAPFGYCEALKRGEIKKQDVPYMARRGGS
jgi:hypothetical protein